MDEARRDNDAARQARIQSELGDLVALIEKDRGLGGRLRKDADNRERVRKAVGIAVKRAIKEIAANDKKLAAHLQAPTLKGGLHPCYSPPETVEWDT